MSILDSFDKYKLIKKVETSKSDEETENDVNSALKEADDILKTVRKSKNKELLSKFEQEYKELENSVINSLIGNNEIVKDELSEIKLELVDIVILAEDNNITKTTSISSRISGFITGANNKNIKEESKKIFNKDLDDYSIEEAKGALKYLNHGYYKYKKASNSEKAYAIYIGNESIDELKNNYEVNLFQEELINKILGNEKGFSNEYILGFDTKIGNHLIKISDYKNKIKEGEDLGGESTAAYLLFLDEKHPNKTDFIKNVRNDFGLRYEKIAQLLEKGESGRKDKVINIFKEYGIIKNGGYVEDFFNGLFERFDNLFSSVDTLLKGINNFSLDEKKKMINYSKENGDELKSNLKKDLLERFSNRENKEQIVNNLISEMFNAIQNENIQEVYIILKKYENEYKTEINKQKTTNDVLNIKKIEARNNFIEAEIKGDIKSMKINKELLIKYEHSSAINENINNEEIDETIKRIKEGENFENIVIDLSKNNKKLARALKDHETKYKDYYTDKKKIEEEGKKNINNDELNTSDKKNLTNSDYLFSEEKYIQVGNNFQITTPKGEEIIISEDEKKVTLGNPEALKNFIDFHDFFAGLNLLSVWEYRNDIVDSMVDININLEDDSLKRSELIKFGNNLVKFINNIPQNNLKQEKAKLIVSNNQGGLKNELKKYSGANSMISDDKTYGIYGKDRFDNDLRNLGIIGNSLGFQKNIFRDILSG